MFNTKIQELTDKLLLMQNLHAENKFYCETRDIWNENSYFKNTSYYSPRIRTKKNRGLNYELTPYDDVYYLFVETYVDMTGNTLPSYFGLDSSWAKVLRKKYQDKNDEKLELFIALFSECVSNVSIENITCVGDVLDKDLYKRMIKL